MRLQKNGPGRNSSLSQFFNVAGAKITFHFLRTIHTKNKILKKVIQFCIVFPMVRSHSGHWPCTESVMNSCLVLPGLEFEDASLLGAPWDGPARAADKDTCLWEIQRGNAVSFSCRH
jgi:hypothetical protein